MNAGSGKTESCRLRSQAVEFVDGELSSAAETVFETHLTGCPECAGAVNDQKRLLCALDIAFDERNAVAMPEEFTRTVVAKAESSVSGLRRPQERSFALFAGIAILLLAVIVLGEQTGALVAGIEKLYDQVVAVGGFGVHLIHDLAVGVAVVSRSLSHRFIFTSAFALTVLFCFFLISTVALARVINRREQI